jgi:aldose 1-epimerase
LTEPGSVQLRAGAVSLTLAPDAGGRASSLVVDGMELLARDAPIAVGWGWYPMAPWPGRLRDNAISWAGRTYEMPLSHEVWAIHGTVYDVGWEVEDLDRGAEGAAGAHAVLGVELVPPWPWTGRVRQTWRLSPDTLETVLEVHTHGEEFPAEVGWHPWFRKVLDRGEPAVLELDSDQMYLRGPDFLPTGEVVVRPAGPYDDTFALPTGEVALHWPGALRLTCRTDCAYVVVFDERPGGICVEPQTAPPDGINVAPGVVAPGRPRVARATWTWSSA